MSFASSNDVRVFYGQQHIPTRTEFAHGGMVKFQWMQDLFPNSPDLFNILYMVSSQPPTGAEHIAKTAKKIGAKFFWNQNGVAYPGWYGWRYKDRNKVMASVLHQADYVFYQSEFCKMAADKFLGPISAPSEILYNPIDTEVFVPASLPHPGLNLLLAGNQYQFYRLEAAVKTLALVRKHHPESRLMITGKLNWLPDPQETQKIAQDLIESLDVAEAVDFLGTYTQAEAPQIFAKAHILLHTRYNDPCPTVVLEALASGIPVVYSHSGGVPELVGEQAGIGIPAKLDWETEQPPAPEALAEAILTISHNHSQYAQAARQRALSKFDIKPWLKRHQEVFESHI